MKFAPVIIPTLNRYEHFKKCIESLEKCTYAEQTDVYIGLDYPPSGKYVDGWRKTDKYLREKECCNNFKSLKVYRRQTNYFFSGKSNAGSIIAEIKKTNDRIIFSEDDNEFSPNFLDYMNKCFEKYQNNQDIVSISGYSYPVNWARSEKATVQIQNFNASAWGRGVWIDKADKMAEELGNSIIFKEAIIDIKNQKYKRLIDPALIEYSRCILGSTSQMYKTTSDIGMRLYIAMCDKYVVSPLISLVRNHGFDGSGVYCDNNNNYLNNAHALSYNYSSQPIEAKKYFEIVENDSSLLEKNRLLLKDFDSRPKQKTFLAKLVVYFAKDNLLGILRFVFHYYFDIRKYYRKIKKSNNLY